MGNRTSRIVVLWLSMAIGVFSVVWFTWDRIREVHPPLWDEVALAYGGVFVLFFLFDEMSRQAAKQRREKDESRPRPKPGGPVVPGQQVAPVSSLISAQQVKLERVREELEPFRVWLDRAAEEVLALDNQIPARDDHGHVPASRLGVDLGSDFLFTVRLDSDVVGCAVLQTRNGRCALAALYIDPVVRRHRVGSHALQKILEFAALLGQDGTVRAEIPAFNMRGQRFLEANGFQPAAAEPGVWAHTLA